MMHTKPTLTKRLHTLLFTVLASHLLLAGQVQAEASALAGQSPAALADAQLKVGDQSGLTRALLSAAGEDRALPYHLAWRPFVAGPPLLEALNAGAIDVGVVGNAPPIFAQAGHAQVRIVAAAEGAQNNNAVLVPGDSTVQQVADLKGKRIAVAKGTSGHYLLLAALAQAGLHSSDVEVVYASPVDAQNAFAGGQLDAWAVWYPFVGQAIAQGARRLLDGSPWPETGLNFTLASERSLDDPLQRALVGDFIQRLARAQAWASANPGPWAEQLAQATRLPLPLVQEMLDHQQLRFVPLDDRVSALQQRLADAFAQARLIPRPVQVSDLFDPRYNVLLPTAH